MKTIKLKEKFIERLNTHYWIFSNEIEKHDFSVENGEIVNVIYSNGDLCGYGFYNPHSLISIRLITKGKEIESDFIIKKIHKAYQYRKNLGITDGRMFFGESDGIGGLVIDKYKDVIVIEVLSAGVERIIEDIKSSVKKIFLPNVIIVKRNHPYRLLEGLKITNDEISGKLPDNIIIEENGLKFQVDLISGQKTGWYFDQRDNRTFLIPYFKNKKVLDIHCYTGAFSITAAKNGAKIVWGIDTSQKALELANINKTLNKIDDSKLIFKEEEDIDILNALVKNEIKEKPDFILIDPPNFVRNKKHILKAKKLYIKLLKLAIIGVDKDGYIAFSTCSQHISDEIFNEILNESAIKAKRKTILLYQGTQAKDHPIILGMKETKYLHFALLKVE